jgi:hypothetical protein
MRGACRNLPLPSRKAQLQTLSSHRNGGLLDRGECLSGALVMTTTASSNQTSFPAFTSLASQRFFGAQPILLGHVGQRRSPEVRNLWRVYPWRVSLKRPIRFELQNARLTGTRNLRSTRCGPTTIRPPAGFDRVQRSIRGSSGALLSQLPFNSVAKQPATTPAVWNDQGPLAPTEMFREQRVLDVR